jgi:hypothetical protein
MYYHNKRKNKQKQLETNKNMILVLTNKFKLYIMLIVPQIQLNTKYQGKEGQDGQLPDIPGSRKSQRWQDAGRHIKPHARQQEHGC